MHLVSGHAAQNMRLLGEDGMCCKDTTTPAVGSTAFSIGLVFGQTAVTVEDQARRDAGASMRCEHVEFT